MNNVQKNFVMMVALSTLATVAGCGGGSSGGGSSPDRGGDDDPRNAVPAFTVLQGNDANRKSSPLLSLNPGGPGAATNQSLRAGDILQAARDTDTLMIGALGVDVLVGNDGNDIMIGGTEDFNSSVDGDNLGSDNRDRAFGNAGDDVFIWTPGDGSDFFDGGDGVDVLVLGLLGEDQDNDGNTEGAPFFNVSPGAGSQNFDGIFLDTDNKPIINVSGSPGFCTVLPAADDPEVFEALNLDHLVRFSLRVVANAFDQGLRTDDDGLRVAISTRNVEYLVCTDRETGISVLDLTTTPATVVDLSQIPDYVASMIQ